VRHPRTLEEIAESGLCIGCGICRSLAGPARVEMTMMAPGQLRPKVTGALDDEITAKILDVCPGASIDGAMPASRAEGVFTDPVFGQWAGVTRGYAADDEVRFKAAAGGVLTALGQFVLDTGLVECVLHVQQSVDDPIRSPRRSAPTAPRCWPPRARATAPRRRSRT
jgi:coenzyme F420 hydrogenase subunit beta